MSYNLRHGWRCDVCGDWRPAADDIPIGNTIGTCGKCDCGAVRCVAGPVAKPLPAPAAVATPAPSAATRLSVGYAVQFSLHSDTGHIVAHLTPNSARDVARMLTQAADEIDVASVPAPESLS